MREWEDELLGIDSDDMDKDERDDDDLDLEDLAAAGWWWDDAARRHNNTSAVGFVEVAATTTGTRTGDTGRGSSNPHQFRRITTAGEGEKRVGAPLARPVRLHGL